MFPIRPLLAVALATVLTLRLASAVSRPANDPPRLVKQTEIQFPVSLANSFSRGFCTLLVTVDQAGNVSHPRVLRTTHPDFVAPTILALLSWRFEPALRNGQPIEGKWQQTCWFDVTNGHGSIADYSFGFTAIAGSTAPPQYRFDRAPDVLTVVNPVYPYELALAGVEGKAEIKLVVARDGMPEDVTVTSATNPEFGAALKAMAEACLINPAGKRGAVVPSLMKRHQTFAADANNLTYNRETRELIKLLKSNPGEIATLGDLDAKPRALYQPAPAYPRAFDQTRISGTAEVEFFIDPNGQAQLPRVVTASNPEFGWSAVTAVQQWFFEAPKKNGQGVFVRVQIPIEFGPVIRIAR